MIDDAAGPFPGFAEAVAAREVRDARTPERENPAGGTAGLIANSEKVWAGFPTTNRTKGRGGWLIYL